MSSSKVTIDAVEDGFPSVFHENHIELFVNAKSDANGLRRHMLTSRTVCKVDCGFSFIIPEGYHFIVEGMPEHLAKGLIVHQSFTNGRAEVYVNNLGKEIVVLDHGQKIADLYIIECCEIKRKKK